MKHIQSVTIIGAGKLGMAIATGIRKSYGTKISIVLADPIRPKKMLFCYEPDNKKAAEQSEMVVVAVKPWQLENVLREIKPVLKSGQLLVSTVMGKSIEEITALVGKEISVARVMPNIAASKRQSITCIASNEKDDRIEKLFLGIGSILWIDEKLMNAATVMTGSAIAFAMKFARAMQLSATQLGFDSKSSVVLATQVMKGAAALLEEGEHPEVCIDHVTTPAGCTIAGVAVLEQQGFSGIVMDAVSKSYRAIG